MKRTSLTSTNEEDSPVIVHWEMREGVQPGATSWQWKRHDECTSTRIESPRGTSQDFRCLTSGAGEQGKEGTGAEVR